MLRHKRVVGVICGLALSIESMQASGFPLTEQSLNGTALNSAFIAGAYGADSTYYNPANMSLGRDSDKHEIEIDGTLLFIPPFRFSTGDRSVYECASQNICNKSVEGKALTTIQPIPKFFYKSRAYEVASSLRTNFGVSFTTPSGLSMNWDGIGGGFLDDVSIAMMELNPVVSLAWKDIVSIGLGIRGIYSFGEFNNSLYVPYDVPNLSSGTSYVQQTSNASGFGVGYNAALTIKPFATFSNENLKSFSIAATYRSKVSIDAKGKLQAVAGVDTGILGKGTVDMNADLVLMTDLPHIINLAVSQDFGRNRIEFVWEYTFWSSARIFEFGYTNQVFSNMQGDKSFIGLGLDYISNMLGYADYSAVAYGNGWKDSNAYRLGYTYFGESYKIMGSIAHDETPAPQGKFGIPDANAYMFGLGFRKRFLDDRLDLGLAYSLALKDNRKSFIVSHDGFGQLHLLTIGAKYLW
ncbi:OmpP1/FadL family transporter [Helicobacter bilis]|uniref:OmpP1/FadL family transporter n=1 Tax=Helicobacter bilis TaxID=37372 RepID=UPI000CF047AE|nr:outer membrane protein transport protein [Helicobacter bilis]